MVIFLNFSCYIASFYTSIHLYLSRRAGYEKNKPDLKKFEDVVKMSKTNYLLRNTKTNLILLLR